MIILAVSLGILALVEAIVILTMSREMKRRNVSLEDISERALELSTSSHLSYDAAMQSLVSLTYTIPGRLRK